MKHACYLIPVFILLFSCESSPSTVCDMIEPDHICMDYKTSHVDIQTWKRTGNNFTLHITNNTEGNPYIPQLDLYFRLFDHEGDSVPQMGSYKAVSYINTNLNSKQFDVHFYVDGQEDYELDLGETSTFEIESITEMVLDGRAKCYFIHTNLETDKKQLNVNFQGAILL